MKEFNTLLKNVLISKYWSKKELIKQLSVYEHSKIFWNVNQWRNLKSIFEIMEKHKITFKDLINYPTTNEDLKAYQQVIAKYIL